MSWIVSRVYYFESNGNCGIVEDFNVAVIANIVHIHPFFHGNKRTARELVTLISAKLNCPFRQHYFQEEDPKRFDYQRKFTRFLWLRDYLSLRHLHDTTADPEHVDRRHPVSEWKREMYEDWFV